MRFDDADGASLQLAYQYLARTRPIHASPVRAICPPEHLAVNLVFVLDLLLAPRPT